MGASQGPALASVQIGRVRFNLCFGKCPASVSGESGSLTDGKIGYFLKNIDLFNVTNAFLSGMEEDLSMYGNQLVTATSIWTAGYVIGQIPSNMLLTRVSPRWVIPSLELGWGIATIASSTSKTYQALYGWRFMVGLCEQVPPASLFG